MKLASYRSTLLKEYIIMKDDVNVVCWNLTDQSIDLIVVIIA